MRPSRANSAMLIETMLKYLNDPNPPDTRTAESHTWIRRRAAEILRHTGRSGHERRLAGCRRLGNRDTRFQQPLVLACSAASEIGQFEQYPANFDVVRVCTDLANLAVSICKQEAAADNNQEDLNRRRLASGLSCVRIGLMGKLPPDGKHGVAPAARSKNEELTKRVLNNLNLLWKWIDKEGPGKPADLLKLAALQDLEKLIKPGEKAPAKIAVPAAKPASGVVNRWRVARARCRRPQDHRQPLTRDAYQRQRCRVENQAKGFAVDDIRFPDPTTWHQGACGVDLRACCGCHAVQEWWSPSREGLDPESLVENIKHEKDRSLLPPGRRFRWNRPRPRLSRPNTAATPASKADADLRARWARTLGRSTSSRRGLPSTRPTAGIIPDSKNCCARLPTSGPI